MNTVILGANGQLGTHFYNYYKTNKNFYFFSSSGRKNKFIKGSLLDFKKLSPKIKKIKPKIIINCFAYTNVDEAEINKQKALLANSIGVRSLANYCKCNNIYLIHFSTDYVYSGNKKVGKWKEKSVCNPKNFYGKSKLLGEKSILRSKCRYAILRLSWLYGQYGKNNFIKKIISFSKSKKIINIVDDQYGTPTSTNLTISMVEKILFKIKNNEFVDGIYNLCPKGFVNRYNLLLYILNQYYGRGKYNNIKINKVKTKNFRLVAKRPLNTKMCSKKISKYLNTKLKNWQFELKKYIKNIN